MKTRAKGLVFVLLLFSACGSEGAEPARVSPLLSPATPSSAGTSTAATVGSPAPSASPSFVFSDIEIVTTDDPVADVIWSIRFDADWTGAEPAPEVQCRWRMYDESGDQNMLGVVDVTEADDILTQPVYPDEIAGQPVSARIVC